MSKQLYSTENRRMKLRVIALLIILSMLMMSLPLTFRSNAAPETIHVSPASTTAILNNNYVVYVNITDASDLYAWEFQLNYDETILDLTSASILQHFRINAVRR